MRGGGRAGAHLLETLHHLRGWRYDRAGHLPGTGHRPIWNGWSRGPGQRRPCRRLLGTQPPRGFLPSNWFAWLQGRHNLTRRCLSGYERSRCHHARRGHGCRSGSLTGHCPQNLSGPGFLGRRLLRDRFTAWRGWLHARACRNPGRLRRRHRGTRHPACGILFQRRRRDGGGRPRPFGPNHRWRQQIYCLWPLRASRLRNGCRAWRRRHLNGCRLPLRCRFGGAHRFRGTLSRRRDVGILFLAEWRVLRIDTPYLDRRGQHRGRACTFPGRFRFGISRR